MTQINFPIRERIKTDLLSFTVSLLFLLFDIIKNSSLIASVMETSDFLSTCFKANSFRTGELLNMVGKVERDSTRLGFFPD